MIRFKKLKINSKNPYLFFKICEKIEGPSLNIE
jgi:hypothetical protein